VEEVLDSFTYELDERRKWVWGWVGLGCLGDLGEIGKGDGRSLFVLRCLWKLPLFVGALPLRVSLGSRSFKFGIYMSPLLCI